MPGRRPRLGLVHPDVGLALVPAAAVAAAAARKLRRPISMIHLPLVSCSSDTGMRDPASDTDVTAGVTLRAHTVRETGCEPRSGTRSPPTSPIDLRGTTNTRTPPSAIRMVNEGAEEPPRDPMPGSHCFARRPARLCARGPGLSRTNPRHAGAT